MNELVIASIEAGECPMCGGVGRMRIRAVSRPEATGGLVGWIDCPLENPASLAQWVAPLADEPPVVIASWRSSP